MGLRDKLRKLKEKGKRVQGKLERMNNAEKKEKVGYYVVKAGDKTVKARSYSEAKEKAKEFAREGYDVHIEYVEKKITSHVKRSVVLREEAKRLAKEVKKTTKEPHRKEKKRTSRKSKKKSRHKAHKAKRTRETYSESTGLSLDGSVFFGSSSSSRRKKGRSKKGLPKLI